MKLLIISYYDSGFTKSAASWDGNRLVPVKLTTEQYDAIEDSYYKPDSLILKQLYDEYNQIIWCNNGDIDELHY